MCGIAGQWNFDRRPIHVGAFHRFVDGLAHRGPDGRGIHFSADGSLALGQRLLAIQSEPVDGKQPMVLANRFWISFNGEIFNHAELRTQLRQHGYSFRTSTDTEVILAAYAHWGEECLFHFNGMWAFAIWDQLDKKMFLSVDRLSVKSLVYVDDANYFAFASEMKTLPNIDRFEFGLNENEVVRMLKTSWAGNTNTFLRGVYRLPAGHSMVVQHGQRPVVKRWWNSVEHIPQIPKKYSEQVECLHELLSSSVKLRLNGRSKISIPLSGGIDSSTMLALAAKVGGLQDIKCYFVKKHGLFDEQKYAFAMAESLGLTPTVIESARTMSIAQVEEVVFARECFSLSSYAPYQIYRQIKQDGASVTLDGHGGDELFGGYDMYMPHAMGAALQFPCNPFKAVDLLQIGLQLPAEGLRTESWKKAGQQSLALLKKGWALRNSTVMPEFDADPLSKYLYEDTHHGFMQRILRIFDYASMNSGVEARTPFLDWRILVFSLALPADRKIGHAYTKRIVRDAMVGMLPETVLRRKDKVGFIDDLNYFFNPEIINWMEQQFDTESFRSAPFWNANSIVNAMPRWKKVPNKGSKTGISMLACAQANYLIERLRNIYHESQAAIAQQDANELLSCAA